VPVSVLFNNNQLNLKVTSRSGCLKEQLALCGNGGFLAAMWYLVDGSVKQMTSLTNLVKFTRKYNNGYLLTKKSTL